MYCLSQEAQISTCIQHLTSSFREIYHHCSCEHLNLMSSVANMTLRKIAQTDAPYHDVEHTILVTLTGIEILKGKHILEGSVSCSQWLNTIISLLCHDIGYLRGICRQDSVRERLYTTGGDYEMIYLWPEASDASLTPYHVDRSKQFVAENFGCYHEIDIAAVQQNIELTRFPVPQDLEHRNTVDYPGLARAADLIGQLADPNYLHKMSRLFREFEEVGVNHRLGYHSPIDLRLSYPNFFWTVVYPYIQQALQYLDITSEGRQIIAVLYQNVSTVEQELKGNLVELSTTRESLSRL